MSSFSCSTSVLCEGTDEVMGGGRGSTKVASICLSLGLLPSGLTVNWCHRCVTFIENNIPGLSDSQLRSPPLVTAVMRLTQQVTHHHLAGQPSPHTQRYVFVLHLASSCRKAHMRSFPHSSLGCNCPRRRPESCSIAHIPLLTMLTIHSAMPFNEGEYSTNKMIWMLCLSQSALICPAMYSFALLNITILILYLVLFSIRLTYFLNLIDASNFALNRSTQFACE